MATSTQEAAIIESLNLGAARAVLENKPASPLGQLLLSQVQMIVERLKDAMKNRDINTASLGLSQSVAASEVSVTPSGVSVQIEMDFYWKFVNYGVNGTEINRGAPNWGTQPPGPQTFFEAIRDWIPKRGLMLPPSFRSYDSFTFAIMENVRKKGKEARPFFADVVNDALVSELQGPIEDIIGRSIIISIVEPWQ